VFTSIAQLRKEANSPQQQSTAPRPGIHPLRPPPVAETPAAHAPAEEAAGHGAYQAAQGARRGEVHCQDGGCCEAVEGPGGEEEEDRGVCGGHEGEEGCEWESASG